MATAEYPAVACEVDPQAVDLDIGVVDRAGGFFVEPALDLLGIGSGREPPAGDGLTIHGRGADALADAQGALCRGVRSTGRTGRVGVGLGLRSGVIRASVGGEEPLELRV